MTKLLVAALIAIIAPSATAAENEAIAACGSLEAAALLNNEGQEFWALKTVDSQKMNLCYLALKEEAAAATPEEIAAIEYYFNGRVRIFSNPVEYAQFTTAFSTESKSLAASINNANLESVIPVVKAGQGFSFITK